MKDLFFKVAAILLLFIGSCFAQDKREIVGFPFALSAGYVDMGDGHYQTMISPSFGWSFSLADVNTTNNVDKSIGIYYEGLLGQGVNPTDNWLLWSDAGIIGTLDGLGAKAGLQTSGIKQGDGFFFGLVKVLPIPDFASNLSVPVK